MHFFSAAIHAPQGKEQDQSAPVFQALAHSADIQLLDQNPAISALDHVRHFPDNRQFLVRRNGKHPHGAVWAADAAGLLGTLVVFPRIEVDAEGLQSLEGCGADAGVVLADASGKDNAVYPAQHRHIGADVLAVALGLHL